MSTKFYDNNTFTLDDCTGEAQQLFGDSSVWGGTPPTIQFKIAKTGDVTFVVANAKPVGTRNFMTEVDNARLLSDGCADKWPDMAGDLIIGHLNYKDAKIRQLFFIWLRPTSPLIDPASYLTLKMYFLKNGTPFDQCPETLATAGVGQDSGGGTGHGPN